jgi:hypothetical protein
LDRRPVARYLRGNPRTSLSAHYNVGIAHIHPGIRQPRYEADLPGHRGLSASTNDKRTFSHPIVSAFLLNKRL